MSNDQMYLGDSVYATFDGYNIWLFTDNGNGPNTPVDGIALEPAVLARLDAFRKKVAARGAAPDEASKP